MMRKFLLSLVLVTVIGAFSVSSAVAKPSFEDQSRKLVEDMTSDIISFLEASQEEESTQIESKLNTTLSKYFDLDRIGRFVLGTYWRQADKSQQTEYLKLFRDYVVGTYAKNFDKYNGQKLTVKDVQTKGKYAMVRTYLTDNTSSQPIVIDWRVRQGDQNNKIVDVIIEGVSMSLTQRSDFAAVIERNGGKVDALLETLREKKGAELAHIKPAKTS